MMMLSVPEDKSYGVPLFFYNILPYKKLKAPTGCCGAVSYLGRDASLARFLRTFLVKRIVRRLPWILQVLASTGRSMMLVGMLSADAIIPRSLLYDRNTWYPYYYLNVL